MTGWSPALIVAARWRVRQFHVLAGLTEMGEGCREVEFDWSPWREPAVSTDLQYVPLKYLP